MATRGYPPPQHHYQQQQRPPPSREYGYDQRPDPRSQPPPPQQRMPPQRQPQYDGYQDQYGYQNDYGYSQQGQWQEQNQDQYYQNDHRGHPPPQRQYNYDERYHQHDQGRQPPMSQQNYPDQRPRDRHPAPPPNQRSPPRAARPQKPRERILTRPDSPETLAWDNPFGAFPGKKKDGARKDEPQEEKHRRHGSLDATQQRPKDWDAPPLRLQDPEGRPHTSQDHRRNEPPRPNTSHGQRPQMSPPLNQGERWGRSKADLVGAGPPRPMPPGDPRGPPQRPHMPPGDPRAPPPRPTMHAEAPRPGPSQRPPMPVADSRPGPPQRAATQPNIGPAGVNGHDYNQRPPRQFDVVTDRRPPLRQPSDHQYDREPERGPPLAKARTFDQGPRSPDMPNFDAMAPNMTETLTGPRPTDQPSYAKKSYQALAINTASGRPPPPQAAQSPLAEFAFGLPHSNSAPPAIENRMSPSEQDGPGPIIENTRNVSGGSGDIDYNNPPMSPLVTDEKSQGHSRKISPSSVQSQQGRVTPAQQFPPRKASRPDQPGAYAEQQDSGYWTASPERGPPHRGAPEHGYEEFARGPDYSDGYGEYSQGPYQQGGSDQYGAPRHEYAPTGFGQGPLRPHTSNSAHPQPMRDPRDRVSGPDMPPSAAGGFDRPPPFRPGLMNQQPIPQPQQPPPMRQPPPQAPPARPQQMPPPQQAPPPQAPPQESRRQSAQSEESKQPPVTIAELNSMREQFKERPQDFPLGLRFAKRLVEAAKTLSSENGRADPKTTARNRERYVNDAFKVVKKLVNAGSTEAMFYLADCYGQGSLGLPVDAKEAFHLYQSAAKLNHAQSAYRVAVCCELGHEEGGGTRRDPMKAIQWYKRAATLGDTPAMYKMGMILLKGLLGQPRNPREAVSWLKRAAERADKENPHALHELGLLYESAAPSDHILRDEGYAFQLFHQAAELGYKYSQFRLGSAFEYGALGCPIDQRQSIAWYSRAAQQGEHQSELALSGWYLTGAEAVGVKQNDQEAFLWARKAASSGLAKAEFAMGYFAENGIGTPVDPEEARRWYYRAAAQGFPKAKERLEELKQGAKAKGRRDRDIRRSNAKEGDCVVM